MYIIDVHGVKSAAASIGAYKLSEKAKLLEEAGKKGDLDYIYRNNEEFIKEYNYILDSIESKLNLEYEDIKLESATEDEVINIINGIKLYLDEFDSDNAMKEIKLLLKKDLKEDLRIKIENLSELIEMFEYEEAIEVIESIK